PIPETPLLDVEECYTYLSELLLRHAVHCPPVSAAVFGLAQVAHIAAHLLETVLRHARLYGYILTPQTCLDLTLVYVGSPEHGQEVEVSTALLQEEGEIPGNPNKGLLCGHDQCGTCLSPAEISMTKEDASGSLQTSPRSKKHLGKPQGSCQGNKGL
ncbi:CC189 protein, partial [Asarcornis scutulata]|nr:CC189 protein [Asarcornis scutulata]